MVEGKRLVTVVIRLSAVSEVRILPSPPSDRDPDGVQAEILVRAMDNRTSERFFHSYAHLCMYLHL